jgi:hypothetical protein
LIEEPWLKYGRGAYEQKAGGESLKKDSDARKACLTGIGYPQVLCFKLAVILLLKQIYKTDLSMQEK